MCVGRTDACARWTDASAGRTGRYAGSTAWCGASTTASKRCRCPCPRWNGPGLREGHRWAAMLAWAYSWALLQTRCCLEIALEEEIEEGADHRGGAELAEFLPGRLDHRAHDVGGEHEFKAQH